MRRILIALALLAAMAPSTAPAVDQSALHYHLSPADKQAILSEPYTIIKSIHRIPMPVLMEMDRLHHGHLEMANPGEPFNATDAITTPAPFRRLVFAVIAKDYCIVHYEHGGRGYNCPVAIFKLTHNKAHCIGFLVERGPLKDPAALKKVLSGNTASDYAEIMNL